MKVVIDNNIVVDALYPNPEFEPTARKILSLAGEQAIDAYVCANSYTDIFYVVRKAHGAEFVKQKLTDLAHITTVIDLTAADVAAALALPLNDFEDAVVVVCAAKIGADCIVSRDERFIKSESPVKVVAPDELLRMLS